MVVPEWIPYYEECYVDLVCIFENLVARRFDHFSVGEDDGAAIVGFLLRWNEYASQSWISSSFVVAVPLFISFFFFLSYFYSSLFFFLLLRMLAGTNGL